MDQAMPTSVGGDVLGELVGQLLKDGRVEPNRDHVNGGHAPKMKVGWEIWGSRRVQRPGVISTKLPPTLVTEVSGCSCFSSSAPPLTRLPSPPSV